MTNDELNTRMREVAQDLGACSYVAVFLIGTEVGLKTRMPVAIGDGLRIGREGCERLSEEAKQVFRQWLEREGVIEVMFMN